MTYHRHIRISIIGTNDTAAIAKVEITYISNSFTAITIATTARVVRKAVLSLPPKNVSLKKYVNFEKTLPRVKICGIMFTPHYFIGGNS